MGGRVRLRAGAAGLRRRRSVRGEPSPQKRHRLAVPGGRPGGSAQPGRPDLRQICGAIRRPAGGLPLGGLGGGFVHRGSVPPVSHPAALPGRAAAFPPLATGRVADPGRERAAAGGRRDLGRGFRGGRACRAGRPGLFDTAPHRRPIGKRPRSGDALPVPPVRRRLRGALPPGQRSRPPADQVVRLRGHRRCRGIRGPRPGVRPACRRVHRACPVRSGRGRDRHHEVPPLRHRRRDQQDDRVRLAGGVHHCRIHPCCRRDRLPRIRFPARWLAAQPWPVDPGHRGGGGGLPAGQGTDAAPGQPAGVRQASHAL